jgi:hypothetical protein
MKKRLLSMLAILSFGSMVNAQCTDPSALGASINADTAFLMWTANSSETSWNIEYGPSGFVLGSGTQYSTDSNPDTLTGLMPSAYYQFYVQADCGGETSAFVGPYTFTTALGNDDACDAVELPVDGVFRPFYSTGATSQGEPISGSGGSSTWFYFEHPAMTGAEISLCGSSFDTKVYAFTQTDCSDFGTYTQLAYNDDDCGLSSRIQICGTPGEIITVMVDGFSGASGDFVISIAGIDFEAGTGSLVDVCAGDTVNLWNHLSGQGMNGGYWSYPQNWSTLYNDSLALTGNMSIIGNEFYYIINSSCGSDTATVTINAHTAAYSGEPTSSFEGCNTGDVFLFSGLTGTVDFGGVWSDDSNTGLLNGSLFMANGSAVGPYQFTYTVDNGYCPEVSTTVTLDLLECAGIDALYASNFAMYPNPTTGIVNFEFGNQLAVDASLSIVDLNGKVVFATTISEISTIVDLSHLIDGVYNVVVRSNDNLSNTKLVLTK